MGWAIKVEEGSKPREQESAKIEGELEDESTGNR